MQHHLNNQEIPKTCTALLLGLFMFGTPMSLAAASGSVQSIQQDSKLQIKGVVLDETGEPVIGASVVVKGSSTGGVTDLNGRFSVSARSNAVLTVSYIGYKTMEIPVAGKSDFRVVLQPEASSLDEVVVTALGIKREKKALGYAMQEVKTDGLTENKSFSVANMLQGKVAGVQISQSGTGLGGSTRIVMRGLNSLSGNNQPLWVVDGFPINDNTVSQADQWGGSDYAGAASEINPEDIESISVLKGANAAALYGSRAQNGAIVITTKKGKYGQPLRVEYNGTLDITNVYSPYDYQNVYGQGKGGAYDMKSQMSWGAKMTGQTVDNWRNVLYGDTSYQPYALTPQKDYIKDFYRTGTSYTNTVTASAGGEYATARLSFTDTRANSVVPNYNQNRQYFDLNAELKSKVLTLGAKMSYMNEHTNNRPGQGEYGLMVQLVKMPRGIRLVDLQNPRGVGAYMNNVVNWSGPSDNYANPYGLTMSENGNKSERNRFIGQLSATARFTDYLRLTGRVGVDWYNDNIRNYSILTDPTSSASQYAKSVLTNKEFNADLILYFDKTFGDFSVNANLGTSMTNMRYEGLAGSSGRFAVPGLATLSNGLTQTVSETFSKKEIQSMFFSASFGYKSMAYLDITGRNDWSSTLPASNRSYFYPSVSLSGILSEMFKLPDWVTYWKVRGSLAKVGNDTDPYKLASLYYLFTTSDNVNPSIIKSYMGATKALADLKPESTLSGEVGTEIRLFDNRLSLDFTYYNTKTTNQILSVTMPSSSGFTAKSINAGKITSHGFELMLNGTPVKTKDWQWDLGFNWGLSRTLCKELDSEISRFTMGATRTGSVVVDEGGKFGDIVGKAFKRDANGNIVVDGNGLPQSVSDQVIGNMMPNWTGSVSSSLRYKDFTFSALVDVRQGGKFISNTDNYACQQGTSAKTLKGREAGDEIIVEGVTEDGKANTKKVSAETYWSAIAGPEGIAEAFTYKGTYVKMREMSLGYILPQAWFRNTPIRYVKVALVGRDLFYFYKAAPVNPEGAFSRSDYAQAFELASMPPTRSIGFSLNVKF
uniref:SusC/RagA family TonB-linked outer membrane protein n=1 Tax=Prevotella sp. GTC17260 TaxID=3236796 RepID=A0AB33JKI9_9BACT